MKTRFDPLLLFHIVFLFLITANPFYFGWPTEMGHIAWRGSWLDIPANVVLFVPLGLVLRTQRCTWHRAIWLGAIASVSIEVLQLFSTRVTSLLDVGLNVLGVALVTPWKPNRVALFRRAMALTVPLWSVGLLWPQLDSIAGAVAAAILVASGTLFWAGGFRFSDWVESGIWVTVSCASLATNAPVPAVLLIAAGFAGSLLLPRVGCELAERITLIACMTTAATLLLGGVPIGYPLDVWRGHGMILFLGLGVAPFAMRMSWPLSVNAD
ncbi:MAG: VanZ family protein [Leptolyngbyaceae cyanobacterium]